MNLKGRGWPQSLLEVCRARAQDHAVCGDLLVTKLDGHIGKVGLLVELSHVGLTHGGGGHGEPLMNVLRASLARENGRSVDGRQAEAK